MDILAFLASHADLVILIKDAIENGVDKDHLVGLVKTAMTLASDIQMKAELK